MARDPSTQCPDPGSAWRNRATWVPGTLLAPACPASDSSSSESDSSGSGSTGVSDEPSDGACVEVMTDVTCDDGGVTGTLSMLCGTVTIGGVVYPVTLTLS